jgi:hypothetical protein
LRRLENEIALETALEGTGIDDLPERASGVVELVRRAGGEPEVREALARHGLPLRAFLFDRPLSDLSPALVHQLAVLADHALDAALRHGDAPGGLDVPRIMDRTIAAWLELGRDPSHLLAEAARAAGPTVSGSAIASIVDALPLRGLERCRALAAEGLLERTRTGARAVRALRRALATAHDHGWPAELARRACELARGALDDLEIGRASCRERVS